MTVDISTDYLSWDNTEAVEVIYHIDAREQPAVAVANALRIRPMSPNTFVGGVQLPAEQVDWWIPIAQLGSDIELDTDGVVVDAEGLRYRLNTAERVSYGGSFSHWNCKSTRET